MAKLALDGWVWQNRLRHGTLRISLPSGVLVGLKVGVIAIVFLLCVEQGQLVHLFEVDIVLHTFVFDSPGVRVHHIGLDLGHEVDFEVAAPTDP